MSWSDPLRNVPKPEVENHYHVLELIKGQEKRTQDRNDHREREKVREERNSELRDVKPVTITDFHCDVCNKDFRQVSYLHMEKDWTCDEQVIAFYKGKCRTCEMWAVRHVSDRYRDGFFYKSQAVRIDRGKHHADLIQPHEENFNLLYGKRN